MKREHELALNYHENTKHNKLVDFRNLNKVTFAPQIQYKYYLNNKKVKLSKIEAVDTFSQTVKLRKSTRDYNNYPVSLNEISKLLDLSASLNGIDDSSRVYPSAGKRYPLEMYIAIFNSNDIEKGIYHYDVISHSLTLVKSGCFKEELYHYSLNQELVLNSSMLIVLTAVFDRTLQKYSNRGYRYVLIDAGHIGQSIYLASTYLELGVVSLGGFKDNDINKLLKINESKETSLYLIAIGK
ncbi:SagB/ThcOx family dehydrogenase [Proteinivorax tanatarense]|uniref:SagB/ThcOx family dehydrogenase n=1 Tax=Proteinivorax tanatarense TaxID=1260629 RepID=A0AAU7VJB1_9FIRM